jgi:hypothetical protein
MSSRCWRGRRDRSRDRLLGAVEIVAQAPSLSRGSTRKADRAVATPAQPHGRDLREFPPQQQQLQHRCEALEEIRGYQRWRCDQEEHRVYKRTDYSEGEGVRERPWFRHQRP